MYISHISVYMDVNPFSRHWHFHILGESSLSDSDYAMISGMNAGSIQINVTLKLYSHIWQTLIA